MPNWYDVFAPAASNGTLPNKKTAKAFRYRKSIIWQIDLTSLGISGGQKRFEWTPSISNGDGSQLFFKQTVGLVLFFVSLGVPGLQLATWNYVRDEFDTSMVAGVPVTKDTIGPFLLGGTAASEQGDLQPASGEDSTDLTLTVITDWYSPIYLFRSPGRQLPTGYKFSKSRDTGGIGNLQSTYQFAFEEGAPASLGSTFDPLGALLTARQAYDGERIFTGRAWGGSDYELIDAGGVLKGTSPTLHRLRDGRQMLTLQTALGVVEMETMGSRLRWKRVGYPTPEGDRIPAPVFEKEAAMPVSLLVNQTTRLHIAIEGASLFSRVVTEGGLGEKTFVGAAGEGGFSLERGSDGVYRIIGADGKTKFKRRSLSGRWEEVK